MYSMIVAFAWLGYDRIHAVWLAMTCEMVSPQKEGSLPAHAAYGSSLSPRKPVDQTTCTAAHGTKPPHVITAFSMQARRAIDGRPSCGTQILTSG